MPEFPTTPSSKVPALPPHSFRQAEAGASRAWPGAGPGRRTNLPSSMDKVVAAGAILLLIALGSDPLPAHCPLLRGAPELRGHRRGAFAVREDRGITGTIP